MGKFCLDFINSTHLSFLYTYKASGAKCRPVEKNGISAFLRQLDGCKKTVMKPTEILFIQDSIGRNFCDGKKVQAVKQARTQLVPEQWTTEEAVSKFKFTTKNNGVSVCMR